MGITIYPVPSAAAKIQKTTVITSTQSWTVPADVTSVELLLCGGGAGGNYIPSAGDNRMIPGGSGSVEYFPSITVTPGSTHTITIGAGGGQASANTPGLPPSGGSSSFGSLATVSGGMSVGALETGYTGDSMYSGTPGGRGGYPAVIKYVQSPGTYYANYGTVAGLMGYGGAGAHAMNGNNEHAKFAVSGGGSGGYNYYNGSAYVAVAGGNGFANTGGGGGAGYSGSGIWSNAGNGGSGVAIIKYWSAL